MRVLFWYHRAHECTVVRDPEARKKIAFQSNLYFNCINNHRVSQCNSKNRCRKCHKRHHTSHCNEKNNQQVKRPNEAEIHNQNQKKNMRKLTFQNKLNLHVQPLLKSILRPDKTSNYTLCTTLSNHYYHEKQTILKTAINSLESCTASATAHSI